MSAGSDEMSASPGPNPEFGSNFPLRQQIASSLVILTRFGATGAARLSFSANHQRICYDWPFFPPNAAFRSLIIVRPPGSSMRVLGGMVVVGENSWPWARKRKLAQTVSVANKVPSSLNTINSERF